jgi:hypothetical protein
MRAGLYRTGFVHQPFRHTPEEVDRWLVAWWKDPVAEEAKNTDLAGIYSGIEPIEIG